MMLKLVNAKAPNADERRLAQAVNAHGFEIRVQALEHNRG